MLSSMRSSFHSRNRLDRCPLHQLVGVHEGEITDEDRHTFAEAAGFPRPAGRGVFGRRQGVRRRLPPPRGRVVHHVVVEQRERVHQLQGGTRIDVGLVVVTAARTHVTPVAERRTEPLAAGEHEAGDLVDRVRQVGVEAAPSLALDVEQGGEPDVDPFRETAEGRRRRP